MLRPSAKSRVSIEYKLLDRNRRHTVPHLHPSLHQVSARCMVSVAFSPSQIHRCPLQGISDVCMHAARRRIHICICRRIPKLFPSPVSYLAYTQKLHVTHTRHTPLSSLCACIIQVNFQSSIEDMFSPVPKCHLCCRIIYRGFPPSFPLLVSHP